MEYLGQSYVEIPSFKLSRFINKRNCDRLLLCPVKLIENEFWSCRRVPGAKIRRSSRPPTYVSPARSVA